MASLSRAPAVVVIGAGLVGLATAWLLCRRGYGVVLVDGQGSRDVSSASELQRSSGSAAALGVLMAGVFHRSSGRAWRLRQRSQLLWRQWRQELAARGRPLPMRDGLLLLAASEAELAHQQALLQDPRRPPGSLRSLDRGELALLWPPPPPVALGGLLSLDDGQLDPVAAMEALRIDALEAGLEIVNGWAAALERRTIGWRVQLANGERLEADRVVITAGLGSMDLIPTDHRAEAPPLPPPLQPVLGQALELALRPGDVPATVKADATADALQRACNWPGAVVWKGINLIQRTPEPHGCPPADSAGELRFWLGATLEPGTVADAQALERLRGLEGDAPGWLLGAREVRRWQGLRARPEGQAAPLLQDLGEGLLLAAGHYRNGVLLAPASAEWVLERIEGSPVTPAAANTAF